MMRAREILGVFRARTTRPEGQGLLAPTFEGLQRRVKSASDERVQAAAKPTKKKMMKGDNETIILARREKSGTR